MGSGKSTLAQALAKKLACEVLQTESACAGNFSARPRNPRSNPRHSTRGVIRRQIASVSTRKCLPEPPQHSPTERASFSTEHLSPRIYCDARQRLPAVPVRTCSSCAAIVLRMSRDAYRGAVGRGGDASKARPEQFDQQQLALEPVPGVIARSRNRYNAAFSEQADTVIAPLRNPWLPED